MEINLPTSNFITQAEGLAIKIPINIAATSNRPEIRIMVKHPTTPNHEVRETRMDTQPALAITNQPTENPAIVNPKPPHPISPRILVEYNTPPKAAIMVDHSRDNFGHSDRRPLQCG